MEILSSRNHVLSDYMRYNCKVGLGIRSKSFFRSNSNVVIYGKAKPKRV